MHVNTIQYLQLLQMNIVAAVTFAESAVLQRGGATPHVYVYRKYFALFNTLQRKIEKNW